MLKPVHTLGNEAEKREVKGRIEGETNRWERLVLYFWDHLWRMENLIKALFELSDGIRYIALYIDGKLTSSSRPGLQNESSSESDKYEELIVNPTLLKLVTQRGNIDCGGAPYVLIRYGHFFEFVKPLERGHVSIGIQPDENPLRLVPLIEKTISQHGL